ncbi:MAG: HAD-IA family hydrolase [Promethearchaeia archaeon]
MLNRSLLKQKKLIIFDLDGTIIKLAVDWQSLKKLLSDRYSERYNNARRFTSISTCLNHIVSEDDESELLKFFNIIRKYESQNIEESEIVEETVYFIKHKETFGVRRDATFAVFSLNTRATIKKSLELARISEKFDYLVGREDVRRWKPDPAGLVKIINHFGVEKKDVLYIGDMQKDLIAAKNAQVDGILVGELKEFVNQSSVSK